MPRADRKKKERGRSRDLYESEGTVSNVESFDYPTWGEGPGLFDTLLVCAGVDPITMDIYDYLDEKEKSEKVLSRDSRSRHDDSYRNSERKRSQSRKHKEGKKRSKSRSKSRRGKSATKESKDKIRKSRSPSKGKRVTVETRDDENSSDWQKSMRRLSLSEVPDGMVHSPLLMKQPRNSMIRMDLQQYIDIPVVDPMRKYEVFDSHIYDDVILPGTDGGNQHHRIIRHPHYESTSNMKWGIQNSTIPVTMNNRINKMPRRYNSEIVNNKNWQSQNRSERYHNVSRHPGEGITHNSSRLPKPLNAHMLDQHSSGNNILDQSCVRPSTANVQLMTSNLLLDPTLKETRILPGEAGLTLAKGPRGLVVKKIARNSTAIELKIGDIIVALDGVNVSAAACAETISTLHI